MTVEIHIVEILVETTVEIHIVEIQVGMIVGFPWTFVYTDRYS